MTDCWVEAHRNPCGPGDSRPTAKHIIEAEGLQGQWKGKTVLVTGCSSGLGIEVAHALALTGAKLYLTARGIDKARKALGQLVDSDHVHLLKLDLNSFSDVRRATDEFLAKEKSLNILITNAGVMHTPEGRTEDGFETQFGTNHLAHFLLINLLIPALKAASSPAFNSRIVILSSIAHRFGSVNFENINLEGAYDAAAAYAQSKTANLWTANALERRFANDGIHTWSVQPGGVATGLMQHMDTATLKALGDDPYLKKIFKNPEQGAATETWAAVSKALEGKGGRYLEDCQIIGAWKEGDNAYGPGYGAHAYNKTEEEMLWTLSENLVGLSA
ncbi:NAD(P)-binding protein [Hortaea werneckii]|nr:NAD(P)-binding protein [Hortaea werneckii]KAI7318904.1 NAD(P)-binding protein [Hortaea werneckii]